MGDLGRKVALVTAVTGQDGAHFALCLLDEGYEVHGVKCRSSSFNTGWLGSVFRSSRAEPSLYYLLFTVNSEPPDDFIWLEITLRLECSASSH